MFASLIQMAWSSLCENAIVLKSNIFTWLVWNRTVVFDEAVMVLYLFLERGRLYEWTFDLPICFLLFEPILVLSYRTILSGYQAVAFVACIVVEGLMLDQYLLQYLLQVLYFATVHATSAVFWFVCSSTVSLVASSLYEISCFFVAPCFKCLWPIAVLGISNDSDRCHCESDLAGQCYLSLPLLTGTFPSFYDVQY